MPKYFASPPFLPSQLNDKGRQVRNDPAIFFLKLSYTCQGVSWHGPNQSDQVA